MWQWCSWRSGSWGHYHAWLSLPNLHPAHGPRTPFWLIPVTPQESLCSVLPLALLPRDGPWISTVALFPVLPPAAPDCLGPLDGPQAWFLTLACLGLLREPVTSTWLCPPQSDPVGLCLIGKDGHSLRWGHPWFQLTFPYRANLLLLLPENDCMIV